MKNPNELETAIAFSRMTKNESAYTIAQAYRKLVRASHALTTIDTQGCNGELDDMKQEKKTISIYHRIATILEPYGLHYYHQTDPRGASLYVSASPITRDNYTNALCIY